MVIELVVNSQEFRSADIRKKSHPSIAGVALDASIP